MTLNSVVFPAPLGPRIARRSPSTMSRSTSRTATRPPKRRPTPRKRRIGSALRTSGSALTATAARVGSLLPRRPDLVVPDPRRHLALRARRRRPRGRRRRGREVTVEGLGHVRDRPDRLVRARQLHELDQVVVADRLAVLVELDETLGRVQPGLADHVQALAELRPA